MPDTVDFSPIAAALEHFDSGAPTRERLKLTMLLCYMQGQQDHNQEILNGLSERVAAFQSKEPDHGI
jgi:hypothetical protein